MIGLLRKNRWKRELKVKMDHIQHFIFYCEISLLILSLILSLELEKQQPSLESKLNINLCV